MSLNNTNQTKPTHCVTPEFMKHFHPVLEHFVACTLQLKEDFRSALFNLALMLVNDLQKPIEAVPYLNTLLKVRYLFILLFCIQLVLGFLLTI